MTDWKPIEALKVDDPIWVIIYMYWGTEEEQAKSDYSGPWPDCHGWYASEADAWAVVNHFPPESRKAYMVKRAHRRVLI